MYKANKTRYDDMQYNHCGKSGLKLPKISLGLWHNFGDVNDFNTARELILSAFDNGVTYYDLANNYGMPAGSAESNFGKILAQDLMGYRDELIIATKAGYTMWEGPYGDFGSRKYLIASLDQSLKRLGLDYVDIFYHHRMDKDTPLEESMMALAHAVSSGKALYAGISNYDSETTAKAVSIMKDLRCPLIVNQVKFNMLDQHIIEDNLLDKASDQGIGLVAFSPLSQGLLSDRYFSGIPNDSRIITDGRFLKQDRITNELVENLKSLNNLAVLRGQTLSQMALSWILSHDSVTTVLVGASRTEQLLDNIKCIDNVEFSIEELSEIAKLCSKMS